MKSIVHVKFYIHYEIGGSDFEISNGLNFCILDFFSNRIILHMPLFSFLNISIMYRGNIKWCKD